MSKTASVEKDELVVLFVRVHKSQRDAIRKLATERKLSVADVSREVLEKGLSGPTKSDLLASIESILIQHSKQAMLNDAKVIEITSNIYATQLGAKAEGEKYDAPEGVFLLPPSPEDKKGKFFCQSCGLEKPNKQKHTIRVQDEEIKVADCCFDNNKYKDLVKALL